MQPHWLLCAQPAEYRFYSAVFYEQPFDEFGLFNHFGEVFQVVVGEDNAPRNLGEFYVFKEQNQPREKNKIIHSGIIKQTSKYDKA